MLGNGVPDRDDGGGWRENDGEREEAVAGQRIPAPEVHRGAEKRQDTHQAEDRAVIGKRIRNREIVVDGLHGGKQE